MRSHAAVGESLELKTTGLPMGTSSTQRELAPEYAVEVDSVTERDWWQLLEQFDDANIYQTWSYDEVRFGRKNISHLLLKKSGRVIGAAQCRIARLPILNVGMAYIRWGPLWRLRHETPDQETFRQVIRALRNEYVCRRKLVLRIYPALFDEPSRLFRAALEDEGYSPIHGTRDRTLLLDIRRPLPQLREGIRRHWQRELKVAEKHGLEVVEGSDDRLFESFITIYKEMVARKGFREPNDIRDFQAVQRALPTQFKMGVMLCKSGDTTCAGLIYSAIGSTALYLFGATSNSGRNSRGSYILQWRLIELLQMSGATTYDLNGINPTVNPGSYKFKADLCGSNGEDKYFIGRFDAGAGCWSTWVVKCGDQLRTAYRSVAGALLGRVRSTHRLWSGHSRTAADKFR